MKVPITEKTTAEIKASDWNEVSTKAIKKVWNL
jgi:hypothetical protein